MATNLKMIAWNINGNKGVEAPADIKPVCDRIQDKLDRIVSRAMNRVYKFGWPSHGGLMPTFDQAGAIWIESQTVDQEVTDIAEELAYGVMGEKSWRELVEKLNRWIDQNPTNLEWLGYQFEEGYDDEASLREFFATHPAY